MSWAGKRRLLVGAIGVSLIFFVITLIIVPTVYQSPSCTDHTQNQDEEGIDCGGSCAYLCTERVQAPAVRFAKAVYPKNNRVDVFAYIDNPNINAAAFDVPYKITLYAPDQSVLKVVEGTFNLPPNKSVPLFVSGVFNAPVTGARAFVTIDAAKIRWFKGARALPVPQADAPKIGGTPDEPRVTATLTNTSVQPETDISVVAVVYDAQGAVIAATQTYVPVISPSQSAVVTFTWSRAFSTSPARIEIVPVPTFERSAP